MFSGCLVSISSHSDMALLMSELCVRHCQALVATPSAQSFDSMHPDHRSELLSTQYIASATGHMTYHLVTMQPTCVPRPDLRGCLETLTEAGQIDQPYIAPVKGITVRPYLHIALSF